MTFALQWVSSSQGPVGSHSNESNGPWTFNDPAMDEGTWNSYIAGSYMWLQAYSGSGWFNSGDKIYVNGVEHVVTSAEASGTYIHLDSTWGTCSGNSQAALCVDVTLTPPKKTVTWEVDGDDPGVSGFPASGTQFDDGASVTVQFTAPAGWFLGSVIQGGEDLINSPQPGFSETFEIHDDVHYVLSFVPIGGAGQLIFHGVNGNQASSPDVHTIGGAGTYDYDYPLTVSYIVNKLVLQSVNGRPFPAATYLLDLGGLLYQVQKVVSEPVGSITFLLGTPLPAFLPGDQPTITVSDVTSDPGDIGGGTVDDPGFREDPSKPVPGGDCTDDGKFVGACILYFADIHNNRMKDLIETVQEKLEDISGQGEAINKTLGEIRDLLPIEVLVEKDLCVQGPEKGSDAFGSGRWDGDL